MHELGKTDAAAGSDNMVAYVDGRALTVRGTIGIRGGQRWRQVLLHVNIV